MTATKPTTRTTKKPAPKQTPTQRTQTTIATKRRTKTAQHQPPLHNWVVPTCPPRIIETAIHQPDPARNDLTVGEAIPIMVLQGCRPVQAAQRLCVFPVTFRNWVARGLTEVAAMSTPDQNGVTRDEPEPKEAPYVWLAMGVMRAEAEWEAWAIEEWQSHTGKDWRAVQGLMRAKFPELYAEKTAVELTGAGGGPVRVAQVPTFEEVEAALARDEAASLVRLQELAAVDVKEAASG